MAFINEHDNVVTRAQLFCDILKAEYRRDDDFPDVLSQHIHQLLDIRCRLQICHIGRMELRSYL